MIVSSAIAVGVVVKVVVVHVSVRVGGISFRNRCQYMLTVRNLISVSETDINKRFFSSYFILKRTEMRPEVVI